MTTLAVHRLHADYHVPRIDVADRLDALLGEVAGHGLSREALGRSLSSSYAVCIPDVAVRVDLDVRASDAELTGAWSDAILDAVEDRLGGGGDEAGGPVVVFRREVDLLVDVVRRVAAADGSRLWAWRLAGAIPDHVAWPSRGDLVDLLVRHPQLVPAVLAGAGDAVIRCLSDDVDSWVALARAVAPMLGPVTDRPDAVDPAGTTGRGLGARSLIPAPVWQALRGRADERAVARLAIVCEAPALARDPVAVSRVLDPDPLLDESRAGGGGRPQDRTRGDSGPDRSAGAGDGPVGRHLVDGETGAPGPAHPDVPHRTSRPPTAAGSGEPTGAGTAHVEAEVPAVSSAHGGVLFLAHGITATDLVPSLLGGPLGSRPVQDSLARVVAAVSGAPVDDPAVLAVSGWRPGDAPDALSEPLDPVGAAAVDDASSGLRSWIDERLGDTSDDAEGDLGWVWRRRVDLEVAPGWIEGTYRLDDVDIRLRVAGLDLDPGFVWWLGAVVRFRHV